MTIKPMNDAKPKMPPTTPPINSPRDRDFVSEVAVAVLPRGAVDTGVDDIEDGSNLFWTQCIENVSLFLAAWLSSMLSMEYTL